MNGLNPTPECIRYTVETLSRLVVDHVIDQETAHRKAVEILGSVPFDELIDCAGNTEAFWRIYGGNEKAFIRRLADLYAEKRQDVSDICNAYLNNGFMPTLKDTEHRYIRANIPGTSIRVEYDTYTTNMAFLDAATTTQWELCEGHQYYDDDDMVKSSTPKAKSVWEEQ